MFSRVAREVAERVTWQPAFIDRAREIHAARLETF
jgi:hypothetical protein